MSTIESEKQIIVTIRFTEIGKLYHFGYSHLPDLLVGDYVIVDTARGRQMGQVMSFIAATEDEQEYKDILRMATPRDMILRQEWQVKEDDALAACIKEAKKVGGLRDVKFVAAQYNYDGSYLTFLFTAEQKAEVGDLWHRLKKMFSAQIEMKQVGPREVAKLMGGNGPCGETCCCCRFLTEFSPVSIKMAKAQGISLNPSEITGMCGRLRCCLVYEYEQYVEARKHLPKRGQRIGTPHGIGRVGEVLAMQDAVSVWIEESQHTVKREDLMPVAEYEALMAKAQEPCEKHSKITEEGPVKSKTAYKKTKAAVEQDSPEVGDKTQPDNKKGKPNKGRSGRRGRGRRRPKKKGQTKGKETNDK
jgi:cell fate regulator YaaT (PSP1 superfamily)